MIDKWETDDDFVESGRARERLTLPKKQKELARRGRSKKLARYSTKELRSEMGKRRYKKRLAKMTPEQIKLQNARTVAAKRIRAQYCDHKSKAPKLRKSGPNAGYFVCPSCNKRVPAPPKPGEGLVV